jgi:hypothetical protein
VAAKIMATFRKCNKYVMITYSPSQADKIMLRAMLSRKISRGDLNFLCVVSLRGLSSRLLIFLIRKIVTR